MKKDELLRIMSDLDACPPATAWVQETEGTVEELWERCEELGWLIWLIVGLLTQHPPQTWRRPLATVAADSVARRRADRVRRETMQRLKYEVGDDTECWIPYDQRVEWPPHVDLHGDRYREALAAMKAEFPADYVAALIHSYYDENQEKTQ